MDPEDAAEITGFLVNKFRANVSLFRRADTARESAAPLDRFGTLPWFASNICFLRRRVDLSRAHRRAGFQHRLRRLLSAASANFDDLDALAARAVVRLTMVPRRYAAARPTADLVILPSTKYPAAISHSARSKGGTST